MITIAATQTITCNSQQEYEDLKIYLDKLPNMTEVVLYNDESLTAIISKSQELILQGV